MQKAARIWSYNLFRAWELCVFAIAGVLAARLSGLDLTQSVALNTDLFWVLAAVFGVGGLLWVIWMSQSDLYASRRLIDRRNELQQILLGAVFATGMVSLSGVFLDLPIQAPGFLAAFGGILFGLTALGRVVTRTALRLARVRQRNLRHVAIVGTGTPVRDLIQRIKEGKDNGIVIDGVFGIADDTTPLPDGVQFGGDLDALTQRMMREPIDEVLVTMSMTEHYQDVVDRFMSTMSHELRTPLNIINGFSKIMSSSSKVIVTASEMREYSDSMLDAGEHLLSVINDIIEFSQVGSDRFIHEPAPEDVRELLSKSISLSAKFQAIDDISGIDVTVASNFGDLVVDEATFRRVLMSLMSNALKFGGQPTRMVVRAFLRPDGCPVISIRDFGPGIEASELERVFEPFYQGEGLRSGQFAGTGLGLPLARELMRLHGGRVELASRPGVGTTASVLLPANAHIARPEKTDEAVPGRKVRKVA